MNFEPSKQPDYQKNHPEDKRTRFVVAAFPEAYVPVDDLKFGRRSAGSGFLEAVCRYVDKDDYALAIASEADLHQLYLEMTQYKGAAPTATSIALGDQAAISRNNALFLPGPVLSDQLWARRALSDDAYSIVGITHTVATFQAALPFSRYFTDPTQNWDALICTSNGVRRVVQNLFENYVQYLDTRNIKTTAPPIQLPVIPLGVHCDHFQTTQKSISAAKTFRETRGISELDVVLLSFGRIDPATKAHPIPLFLSAERAQEALVGKVKLHLVMVGTFLPTKIAQAEVMEAAKKYAPSVTVHWVDGKDKDLCDTSWQAADIFVSLSDNIQESFGLTPVEAMAASLPCIVSDWNGYKETVVDGETGIRVPTLLPDPSMGIGCQVSDRYTGNLDGESIYLFNVAQMTVVDIRKCAEAIVYLARDEVQRLEMGRRGRLRAEQNYGWQHVILQYSDLFAELEAIREKSTLGKSFGSRKATRPELGDPFEIFRHYPTSGVSTHALVFLTRRDAPQLLDSILKQIMCSLPQTAAGVADDVKTIVGLLNSEAMTISDLCAKFPQLSPSQVLASCMWLAKYDIVQIE